MRARRGLYNSIAVILMITATLIAMYSGVGTTYAATTNYSNVLDDLKEDSAFNLKDYPAIIFDYNLNVIQIAESTDGELFVYVYQPAAKYKLLVATSINIAREQNNTAKLTYKNYPLELINSAGVFFKYRVKGFELSPEAVRYYNISNILRTFDKTIDTPPAAGSITEVENRVAQCWTARTVDGNVEYVMTDCEVVEITKKYVGFFDYFDGASPSIGWETLLGKIEINGTHTIRNFVAFSTDRNIEKLMEVELQYSLQDYSYSICANPFCLYSGHPYKTIYDKKKGEVIQQEPIILDEREVTNNPQGWGGNKYTWKTIQTTEEFIAGADSGNYTLTTEGANDVAGTQWVLNFYDAVFTVTGNISPLDNQVHWKGKTASNVMILRLLFETEGKTYNVGVVDNKQTGDGKPDNVKKENGLPKWAVIVIIIGVVIVALVALIVLAIFFPPVGKALIQILKYFFIGLWYVISAPFRLIALIFRKLSGRKAAAPAKASTSKRRKPKAPKRRATLKSRARTKAGKRK